MNVISKILSALKESERQLLYYANEHCISQFVVYKPGRFIGVNVEHIPKLVVTDTSGPYSIGDISNGPTPT